MIPLNRDLTVVRAVILWGISPPSLALLFPPLAVIIVLGLFHPQKPFATPILTFEVAFFLRLPIFPEPPPGYL